MAVQKYDEEEHRGSDLQIKGKSGKGRAAPSTGEKPLPDNYSIDIPDGVQQFDDNGQQEGSTRYLGQNTDA